MTKAELIAKIAKDADLTLNQARKALNSFTETTTAALKAGDKITLVGFGTFRTVHRAARTGRNPQTGEKLKIAAKTNGKFIPGKALKSMTVKPLKVKQKEQVHAKVEVSGFLADRQLDVAKTLTPLVDRLKKKKKKKKKKDKK